MIRWVLSFLVLSVCGAQALDLTLPSNASLAKELRQNSDSYELPIGAVVDGQIPTRAVTGAYLQQAWQISGGALTAQQLMALFTDQLIEAGFIELFTCEARACGGFDFRFNTRVLPSPEMFVDLAKYRFASLQKGSGVEAEYVSILSSPAQVRGYVQFIHVFPKGSSSAQIKTNRPQVTENTQPISVAAGELFKDGFMILSGLNFKTGSSELEDGPNESLQKLADILTGDPNVRVALVGHTDAEGSLEGNIALSKRRAGSVLERLVTDYNVPRGQLTAEGAGYLSPVASNQTAAGRTANRRVEAVLLNTQ